MPIAWYSEVPWTDLIKKGPAADCGRPLRAFLGGICERLGGKRKAGTRGIGWRLRGKRFYSQGNTTDSSCLPLIMLKSFSAAMVPIFSLGWG